MNNLPGGSSSILATRLSTPQTLVIVSGLRSELGGFGCAIVRTGKMKVGTSKTREGSYRLRLGAPLGHIMVENFSPPTFLRLKPLEKKKKTRLTHFYEYARKPAPR